MYHYVTVHSGVNSFPASAGSPEGQTARGLFSLSTENASRSPPCGRKGTLQHVLDLTATNPDSRKHLILRRSVFTYSNVLLTCTSIVCFNPADQVIWDDELSPQTLGKTGRIPLRGFFVFLQIITGTQHRSAQLEHDRKCSI